MRIWQVLPVGPTGYGESPYQSACALAGNPYMIDLALLQKDGYLPDYQPAPHAETGRADFETLRAEKEPWLRRAYQHSRDRLLSDGAFEVWQKQWPWLRDYALFMAIKQKFNQVSWMQWPDEDIRMRRPEAMNPATSRSCARMCATTCSCSSCSAINGCACAATPTSMG